MKTFFSLLIVSAALLLLSSAIHAKSVDILVLDSTTGFRIIESTVSGLHTSAGRAKVELPEVAWPRRFEVAANDFQTMSVDQTVSQFTQEMVFRLSPKNAGVPWVPNCAQLYGHVADKDFLPAKNFVVTTVVQAQIEYFAGGRFAVCFGSKLASSSLIEVVYSSGRRANYRVELSQFEPAFLNAHELDGSVDATSQASRALGSAQPFWMPTTPNSSINLKAQTIKTMQPPQFITVGCGNSTCTQSCSGCGCPSTQTYTLEDYVNLGVDDELGGGFGTQAVRSNAIAYRTYGAYRVRVANLCPNYAICAGPACQAFNASSGFSATSPSTLGVMLATNSATTPFFAEYSAQNNNLASPNNASNCANGVFPCCGTPSVPINNPSCGNGFIGDGITWPCIADIPNPSQQFCAGHRRGLSQYGASYRDLNLGQKWPQIVDFYYNNSGSPAGNRSAFLTSSVSLSSVTAPSTANALSTIAIIATLDNKNYVTMSNLIWRPLLVGASTISGTNSQGIVSMPAGVSNPNVSMSLPAAFSSGSYTSVLELWLDADQNGVVSDSIDVLLQRTNGNVVTVGSGSSFNLQVDRNGAGSGTVSSSPAGINCGSSCNAAFANNTLVTLTPFPSAGSIFSSWSGDCSGSGTCQVTMNQARFVTANFITVNQSFRVIATISSPFSSSGLTLRSNGVDNSNIPVPTQLSLDPVIASGQTYNVSVVQSPPGLTCTTTNGSGTVANSAPQVTVNCVQNYALSVSTVGSGSVTSNPAGINCPSNCVVGFAQNTSVQLTATPGANASFAGWTGACSGNSPSCSVLMSQAQEVTANFGATSTYQVTLTVNANAASFTPTLQVSINNSIVDVPGPIIQSYGPAMSNGQSYSMSVVRNPDGLNCQFTSGQTGTVNGTAPQARILCSAKSELIFFSGFE